MIQCRFRTRLSRRDCVSPQRCFAPHDRFGDLPIARVGRVRHGNGRSLAQIPARARLLLRHNPARLGQLRCSRPDAAVSTEQRDHASEPHDRKVAVAIASVATAVVTKGLGS